MPVLLNVAVVDGETDPIKSISINYYKSHCNRQCLVLTLYVSFTLFLVKYVGIFFLGLL